MPTDARHPAIEDFAIWIRSRFVELNSKLEDCYASRPNRIAVDGIGDELKAALVEEGNRLIGPILNVPDLIGSSELELMDLMGDVGFFMGACRRHEITDPARQRSSPLVEASALALRLGGVLGMVPRFAAAHLQTYNRASGGSYRTFTDRTAEVVFFYYNSRSAFAFMRAADALDRLLILGVSHPVSVHLLADAERAIDDALAINRELARVLDRDEFYFCVRPYFKPYRVGNQEYRGANAGDFAAFNQVDLLLGLCRTDDPFYAQVAMEKSAFVTPDDQRKLRSAFEATSILDQLLRSVDQADQPWFQQMTPVFLRACEALGAVAAHHHDELVARFIEEPSMSIPPEHLTGITASGPPLDVLLGALEKLRDLRLAAVRDDIASRHADLATLRRAVGVR